MAFDLWLPYSVVIGGHSFEVSVCVHPQSVCVSMYF